MTDVRRVYLARHGRTALNADDRLRGLSDPPLDGVGISEAARLAEVLAAKHPTVVISSPLERAVATARAIGRAARAAVVIDARLNDRDYGSWNGKPRAEVVRRYGSIDAAPGVEPLAAVGSRARTALDQLVGEYGSGPLVLVSHDAVNRVLLGDIDPSLTDIGQRTACWNQLSRIDGAWRVDGYDLKPASRNEIAHDPAITAAGAAQQHQVWKDHDDKVAVAFGDLSDHDQIRPLDIRRQVTDAFRRHLAALGRPDQDNVFPDVMLIRNNRRLRPPRPQAPMD